MPRPYKRTLGDAPARTLRFIGFRSFVNHILQPLCGPDAKLGTAMGCDAVADGGDDVEVVLLRLISLSVGGSYQEFPDNCFGFQLPVLEDVLITKEHGSHQGGFEPWLGKDKFPSRGQQITVEE